MALRRHQLVHLLVLLHRVYLSVVVTYAVPRLVHQVQLHQDLAFASLFIPNPIDTAGHGIYLFLRCIRSFRKLSFVPEMVRAFSS